MDKKRFKKVYIEITNICNLNCDFCIKSDRKKEYMSIERFEQILYKISPYTKYIYLHVKGEPLMHPNLYQILQLAHKNNLYVNITTNGMLLDKQIDNLINCKSLRQLNISLHSVEQNANLNINVEEYITKIVNCANKIREMNGTYISYRIWDMNDIAKDKKQIIDTLEKNYNIPDICLQLEKNASIEFKKGIYLNTDNVFEWPSMKHSIVSQTGSCYGLTDQIAILVDGTVVPCCLDQQGDIRLGNIFTQDFEHIINCDTARNMIEGFKCNKLIQPLCKRCDFRVNKRRPKKLI